MQARREETAHWVSLLLSAQCGEEVTADQLLGREKETKVARMQEAQQEVKKLLRKMKRNGLSAGNHQNIVQSLQAAAVTPRTRKVLSRGD